MIKLLGACETTLAAMGSPAQTVWLCGGGGAFDYVYPPTKIRSVLTDNEAVKGWALAAGILLQRIGHVTGAESWLEDAPQGECIALIENLYEPWLKQDWQIWEARIPEVCERIDVLSAASKKRDATPRSSLVRATALPYRVPSVFRLLARFWRALPVRT